MLKPPDRSPGAFGRPRDKEPVMPGQYPPSNFESLVGSFLQSYTAMKASRRADAEQDIRDRQAKRADQLQRIQLDESGYDEIPMPKIGPPPGQSWTQRLGRMISGGPEQPAAIVMKTHQSSRERELANASAARVADREDQQSYGLELEGVRARDARALQAEREAGADRRNREDNAASLRRTSIEVAPRAQAQTDQQRREFFDNAVAAAGGDAVQAMKNVEQFQLPLARKFGATRIDYHAAAARYRDSRAALTRESIASREEIAARRGNTVQATMRAQLRPDLYGQPGRDASGAAPVAQQPSAPAGRMADRDLWEVLRDRGMSADEATARVRARKPQLSAADTERARTNRAFAAELTQRGYEAGVDY
jgi:hypothetical protein